MQGEDRGFYRWRVSIPCELTWQRQKIKGRITDVSYGGARIEDASRLPAEGDTVTLKVQVEEEQLVLDARVSCKVVYLDDSGSWFGLEFEDPDRIRENLIPLVLTFREAGATAE